MIEDFDIKENFNKHGIDQMFLQYEIYTQLKDNSFVHDDWFPHGFKGEDKHPFPIPRLRGDGWWNQELPEWHSGNKKKTCSDSECSLGGCPPSWCTRTPCPACGEYHDNDYLGKVHDLTKEEQEKYSQLLGVKV